MIHPSSPHLRLLADQLLHLAQTLDQDGQHEPEVGDQLRAMSQHLEVLEDDLGAPPPVAVWAAGLATRAGQYEAFRRADDA
jgi:hypothetical protein